METCLRRECDRILVLYFSYKKRPDFLFSEHLGLTMPPLRRLHHNRRLSTSDHIQIASNHTNQSHRNPIKPIKSHSNPIPIQNTFKSYPIPSNQPIPSMNPFEIPSNPLKSQQNYPNHIEFHPIPFKTH